MLVLKIVIIIAVCYLLSIKSIMIAIPVKLWQKKGPLSLFLALESG